jgi:hypothetical protein
LDFWTHLIFGGFKVLTNTFNLKISIFLEVSASFSAQKYSFKVVKVSQYQKYLESKSKYNPLEIQIFSGVPASFSAEK